MPKVLIIEDEPTINMILTEVLTDEGYDVQQAFDGQMGLEMLLQGPYPDIVLADLRMPKMTGKEVIIKMRSRPELSEIPVIIISGAVQDPEEFPPDDHYQARFSKPFDLLPVVEKIGQLVGK